MRFRTGFFALIAFFLVSSNAMAQSVNDKVTKENLNEVFLKSLIIERLNEIRSYKKAPELKANKICQASAKDQVAHILKIGKISSDQELEGFTNATERARSYGAEKKAKIYENLAEISMEGPITYMDLSDEITSKWLSGKESIKAIENKALLYEGISFGVDDVRKMLVCVHVYADKAIGTNLVIPSKTAEEPKEEAKVKNESKPKEEAKEEAKKEVKGKDEPKTKEKAAEKKDQVSSKEVAAKSDSEVKPEAKPIEEVSAVDKKGAKAKEVSETKKEEAPVKEASPAKEESQKQVTSEQVQQTPEASVVDEKVVKEANGADSSIAASGVSDTEEESELPACISPKKFERLKDIADFGVFNKENLVSIRGKYMTVLERVVTADMDGLALVIDQEHDFENGPTNFDYSVLSYQKLYKSSLFGKPGEDFELKALNADPANGHFTYKLKYIRKGIECYDMPVVLRSDSFDDVAAKAEIALANAASSAASLELVWDGDVSMDTKNKTYKNVSIKIPFKKGRANYSPSELISIMDTMVEPGFKIVAADVIAHSSVEGNPERNIALAKLRGKRVIEALRELNGGTMFYGKLETNDSWDTFFEDIKNTEFAADIQGKSREEVEVMLRPGSAASRKMESFLSTQRFAQLNLSLEYMTVEAAAEKQADFREIRNIYYDFGKFYIRKEAGKSLDVFSRLLKQNQDFNLVEIGAHTDSRGSYSFNEKLSQRRAQAVVDYLISKGIDRKRLVPKGYGESELLNRCNDVAQCSEAEHQRNRRTTFRILKEGEEISSVEPDDISVDYAPSFRPEDGLIDLRKELAVEIQKGNGSGAARVYRKIIKRVLVGQLSDDYLKIDSLPVSDTGFVSVTLNNILAKELILKEKDLMVAMDALVKINPRNPYLIYNGMAMKLMKDQSFVDALKSDSAKKSKVMGILGTIKGTNFPQDKLNGLLGFVAGL